MLGNWHELHEKYDGLCDRLDRLTAALEAFPRNDQQHAPAYREWDRWTLYDGGQATAGGALTVGGSGTNLVPAPNGWEAYITSVVISATGASSAATVASYIGGNQEQNLFDYGNSLLGNSPSRLVAFYDQEVVWVRPGEALTFVFASLAASSEVFVKVTGKRRAL